MSFRLHLIPQLDRCAALVRLVQTPAGRVAVTVFFAALLWLNQARWPLEMAAMAAALAFWQSRRWLLLGGATLYWLVFHPVAVKLGFLESVARAEGLDLGRGVAPATAGMLLLLFAGYAGFVHIVRRYPGTAAGRNPVHLWLALYLGALIAAAVLPVHGIWRVGLWMWVSLAGPYLWFFAYSLADAKARKAAAPAGQFGTWFPFWVGASASATPIGKGAAFLRKMEARNAEELAITQLKAVKLLIWVLVLHIVLLAFRDAVHGADHWGIPRLEAALDGTASGARMPVHLAWASVLAHLFEVTLEMTIWGNTIVACCRMAGFRVLRNTYKPFYAITVAEFWNRYYYYFKELLVEFFFYPVYLRWFKRHPRVRLAVATLAAATIGNMLYHFCRDYELVFQMGLWRALAGFQVYASYTLVLGVAIVISQSRRRRAAADGLPLYRRVAASAGVILFFCLLEVFDYEGRAHSLRTHLAFLVGLFT